MSQHIACVCNIICRLAFVVMVICGYGGLDSFEYILNRTMQMLQYQLIGPDIHEHVPPVCRLA